MTNRLAPPLAAMLLIAAGCSDGESGARKVGRAVGETVTDFAHGVGTGVDKRLEVEVELAPSVAEFGLQKTVSKSAGSEDGRRGITVYLMASQPAAVSLVAKALNAEDQEIGRSTVDVEFTADDAKYVTFRFDAEMDSQLVRKYVIGAKPASEQPASPQDAAPGEAKPAE